MNDVNMVSAPEVLKANGVTLTEATRADSPVYDNLIRIRVKVAGSWQRVSLRRAPFFRKLMMRFLRIFQNSFGKAVKTICV